MRSISVSQAAIISFSARGEELSLRIKDLLLASGWETEASRCPKGGLADWVQANFPSKDALIFIGSCGLAVRAIAASVRHKTEDPAVVVIDESGHFAVSLLSGHLGGANSLTENLAAGLGAIAVITTATDRRGIFAVDSWARQEGLRLLNPEQIVEISSKLLAGEEIYFTSDLPIEGDLPAGLNKLEGGQTEVRPDFRIHIRTPKQRMGLELIAPVLSVGIGCRKGTAFELLEEVLSRCLAEVGAGREEILRMASIDLKAREPGLLALAKAWGQELYTFSADQLNAVPGSFTASEFVSRVTGTDNVCERAALCGFTGVELLLPKTSDRGVTVAIARIERTLSFAKERND